MAAPQREMPKTVIKTIETKVEKAKSGKGYDFVLSDASVDRYGDIIKTDGWVLENFQKNPIALFNHSAMLPIGSWSGIEVKDQALRGTLQLAADGTSDRIDEIKALVEAGILRSVSVGFTPIAYKSYQSEDTYGYIYEKQELIECSLVSIPANPNAVMLAKKLNISDETQQMVFRRGSDSPVVVKQVQSAKGSAYIAAHERRRVLRSQVDELISKLGIRALNDAKVRELHAEIQRIDESLR